MKEYKTPKRPIMYYYFIGLLVLMFLNYFVFPQFMKHQVKEVDYGTFLTMVNEGKVNEVEVSTEEIVFTEKDSNGNTNYYKTGVMYDPDLTNRLYEKNVKFSQEIVEKTSPLMSVLLTWILPTVVIIGLGQLLLRNMQKKMMGGGGNAMTFGKSNAKVYVESTTGIKFKDVAGQDEAKEALTEIVDFLHNPKKYTEIGAAMPKGALLVGPPGTGKTLLAKAVAGGGNDEREQTLNQLLTEMDGFDGKKGVMILAATNRPEVLDKALLRPGRFDRRIPVELPDLAGREAILKVHAKKVKLESNVDFNQIARATSGASGAELANIVNEAALRAVRCGREFVIQSDLEESVEVVIAGYQRKNAVISPKEKEIVAYHEIGHALVAAKQTESAPVHKITIIPRTSGALGYTMQVEEGEKSLMSKEEAFNKIATFTGGRAAEELIFGTFTSGASNDIEQATKLARAMVTRFGMSKDFDMMALETVNNQYLGGDTSLACSPEMAGKVDEEVLSIIKDAHEKAINILKENIDKLHELAHFLLEKETITGEEFMDILKK